MKDRAACAGGFKITFTVICLPCFRGGKFENDRMSDAKPYQRFLREELILRDELAIDRTLLANERTLMAYVRLAITLIIAGVSIVHFAMEKWFETIGFLCVPVGIAAGLFGWSRYQKMERQIREIRKASRKRK